MEYGYSTKGWENSQWLKLTCPLQFFLLLANGLDKPLFKTSFYGHNKGVEGRKMVFGRFNGDEQSYKPTEIYVQHHQPNCDDPFDGAKPLP